MSLPLSGKMPPEYCPWHLAWREAQLQYTVEAVLDTADGTPHSLLYKAGMVSGAGRAASPATRLVL
jgi:hypothetical protein